jgi:hypothetical protein
MSISRQDIINAVNTQAALITVANGYHTELGSNLSEWKTNAIPNGKDLWLDVRDGTEEPTGEATQGGGTVADYYLHVTFILFFKSGETIENVRKGIADVYKAIGVDPKWGLPNVVHDTLDDGNDIMMSQDEYKVGDAEVRVRIHYRRNRFSES